MKGMLKEGGKKEGGKMNLKKSRYFSGSIREAIVKKAGTDLLYNNDNCWIPNLSTFAQWIGYYINNDIPVTVVADYDADGVCSGAIYHTIFAAYGKDVRIINPRRMTDGYGLSPNIVDRINEGVLITVDNGITAIDAVKKAKEKGLVVMVMDHHEPKEVLPDADIIVDPHVDWHIEGFLKEDPSVRDGRDMFDGYCAAGLSYMLTRELQLPDKVCDKCSAFAAIATIADVVPLRGANRSIYKDGIKAIKDREITPGLKALIKSLKCDFTIDEKKIGFSIGPMLNAPGRLLDNGSETSLALLTCDDEFLAQTLLNEVVSLNEQRKTLKNAAAARARKAHKDDTSNPLVIYDPVTKAGIIGLVAGQFCEEWQVTTFAFTANPDGSYKGSARAHDLDNVFEALVECNKRDPGIMLGFGGHAKAAGVTVAPGRLDDFKRVMHDIMGDRHERNDAVEYDCEIDAGQLSDSIKALEPYRPFGEGNPEIVFKVNNFKLSARNGKFFSLGKNGFIRIFGKDCCGLAYMKEGYPFDTNRMMSLTLVGTLNPHVYTYTKNGAEVIINENQVNVEDLQEEKIDVARSRLISDVGGSLPEGLVLNI